MMHYGESQQILLYISMIEEYIMIHYIMLWATRVSPHLPWESTSITWEAGK